MYIYTDGEEVQITDENNVWQLDVPFTDVTSNPAYPMTYEVRGSMTMERQINPLIPDEDQAIQW